MAVATAMASKAMATTVMHSPMVNARRDDGSGVGGHPHQSTTSTRLEVNRRLALCTLTG